MEPEVSTLHTLCGKLSHHESDTESFWKKSFLLYDDPEMLNSDVQEGPNETGIDNFQIVPEGKLSFLHSPCKKNSKLENNRGCLKEKPLVYNGFAGDLISPRLNQHETKWYNSNEYLSQPIQASFNQGPYDEKYDLKALLNSKFHRKNMLSEHDKNSLIFIVTNSHRLKKQVSVQKASQFEDQDRNSYNVMGDDPRIEERTVPESFANITTNKANYSLTQKNKTDSTQEVPETYSCSPDCNPKWEKIKQLINEQQLTYHGSAGDLISSIHGSITNIPKGIKNNILESLSQPRASPNEDFINENYDSNKCAYEKIMSQKTAKTINDKVKIAVKRGIPEKNHIYDKCSVRYDVAGSKETAMQHIIPGLVQTKSNDTEIKSEIYKVISNVSKNEISSDSVSFTTECSSAMYWKWNDIDKYIKEQHGTYSGIAGELISNISRVNVCTPQIRQTIFRNLSQPVEHVGKNFINEAIPGQKMNFKISRDLPLLLQSSTCNTFTEYEEVMTITEEIKDTVSLKSPHINNFTENSDVTLKAVAELTETIKPKDVHTNNSMQSCDMLNISTKHPLIGINSCNPLQEQLDQAVPNEVKTVDYDNDECPCIMHNTDSPYNVSNNSECKSLSPDVFAGKDDDNDDISLYSDSPVIADNTYLNTDINETAQNALNPEDKLSQKKQNVDEFYSTSHVNTVIDTPIYKLSQNIPEQLKAKETDEINDFINRAEKKTEIISFEDEMLIENTDCLYASDMFPICLTQPAVPTYLLKHSMSELSDNSSKNLETDKEALKDPKKYLQQKTEKTIDQIDIDSSSENENTCRDSCKSIMSKIILCTKPSSSPSLCQQNSVVLTNDNNNSEASQQKMVFSVSSNCDTKVEENINIEITPQNDKMQLKNQLHQTNMYKTELKEANARNGQSYNKNVHSNADENSDTQLHLSPKLENRHKAASNNKYQQAQGIENMLVSNRDVFFISEPFKQLDSCITSVALQNVSILNKQALAETADNNYQINKSTNDRQSDQIMLVNRQSDQIVPVSSVNCMNAAYKPHSNNHPGLTQHSLSNGIYLDVAENLCNEYSLGSVKPLKGQTTFKDNKEDCREMDMYEHSSSEEYDSVVSYSEATSESNIDLHIDDAIEKYQNASSGSIQETQNKVNSMEVSIQTDIFGLIQMKHCICKEFQFCCEFCNEKPSEVSENKEKKRQAIASDSQMPLNKKAKCYSPKMEIKTLSKNAKTENKMQVIENIKCAENIKTLSQVYFNKNITLPQPVTHDDYISENKQNHHEIQGIYNHTQLFSWCTPEKSDALQRSQEANEQKTQQNPKPRGPLRIGLSKRAKTKPLHYSTN